MSPIDPFDRPIRVTLIDGEVVFTGDGPVNFSMTRAAAVRTLENLSKALNGHHVPDRALAKGLVVLIVDDEVQVRVLGAAILEDAGYGVIEASGSDQAIVALESGVRIDLLFTDIQMPGAVDGLALAHIVKTRWPAIKQLITSGQGSPPRSQMPEGGRFLAKPYDAATVLKQVEELTLAA